MVTTKITKQTKKHKTINIQNKTLLQKLKIKFLTTFEQNIYFLHSFFKCIATKIKFKRTLSMTFLKFFLFFNFKSNYFSLNNFLYRN